MLVGGCKEKIEDRKERRIRQIKGISRGVLIHFQAPVQVFSSKKTVRTMRVTMWMMVMAQPWTDARARGVKIRRA